MATKMDQNIDKKITRLRKERQRLEHWSVHVKNESQGLDLWPLIWRHVSNTNTSSAVLTWDGRQTLFCDDHQISEKSILENGWMICYGRKANVSVSLTFSLSVRGRMCVRACMCVCVCVCVCGCGCVCVIHLPIHKRLRPNRVDELSLKITEILPLSLASSPSPRSTLFTGSPTPLF